MIPLAFFGYLVIFYVLPWHRTVLFQWVWVHAPRHFPRCVFSDSHGHLAFNGAFYLEMWLWWLGFLVAASLVEAALRRDEASRPGLFPGFARGIPARAYTLAALLCAGLGLAALVNGGAPQGVFSLGLALLTTLSLPALPAARRPVSAQAEAAGGSAAPPSDTVAADARPLRPEDFPPFAPDIVADRVAQALAAPVSPPSRSAIPPK